MYFDIMTHVSARMRPNDPNYVRVNTSPNVRYSARLGSRLKTLRLDRGLSQEELADLTGLSRNSIHALESGKERNPHLRTLFLLQDALDLSSLEELLGLAPSANHELPPERPGRSRS